MQAVETVREFLTGAALTLVLDLPFMLIFAAIMYHYSPTLTWVAVSFLGLILLLSALGTPALRRAIDAQFLYKQGEAFVFMDNSNYEQYELSKEQVDDAWKWIKEGTVCSMLLYNGNPISMEPPNHMVLKIEYAEPAVRGNTATNLTKPVKLETGAEVIVPAFIEQGDTIKVDTRTGEYLERVKV
jgi:hypothetical protein